MIIFQIFVSSTLIIGILTVVEYYTRRAVERKLADRDLYYKARAMFLKTMDRKECMKYLTDDAGITVREARDIMDDVMNQVMDDGR